MTPRLLLPMAAALLAAACGAPDVTPVDDPRGLLEERQHGFLDAAAARDADALAGFFSESAVLHIAGMPPVEGRAAIRRLYGNVFRALEESSTTPEALHVAQGGDMAYSRGRTSSRFSGPEWSVEYDGKFLLVWENQDGNWMIAAYSISSNAQDPGR